MLRGRCAGLFLGRLGSAGTQLRGWFKELMAEVLQLADGADVWVTPRQPRLARSSTAQTNDRQVASPGNRPMTLTRRWDSPKVRSMKLECRMRFQCSRGKRKCTVSEAKSSSRQATALG